MKLWLLQPRNMVPWQPWYDKAFAFVVRAETELVARQLASVKHGDEGQQVWLDTLAVSCEELLPEGPAQIIIRDFAYA